MGHVALGVDWSGVGGRVWRWWWAVRGGFRFRGSQNPKSFPGSEVLRLPDRHDLTGTSAIQVRGSEVPTPTTMRMRKMRRMRRRVGEDDEEEDEKDEKDEENEEEENVEDDKEEWEQE